MSHELTASELLAAKATQHYDVLRAAVTQYAERHNAVMPLTDLVQMIPAYAELIMAAEAVKAAADAADKALRAMLAQVMEDTGAPAIAGWHHTVTLQTPPAAVIITNEAAIPNTYLTTKTTPDKAAIRSAISRGMEVPGAVLTNGAPVLSIRKRKQ
jgi:hypothetical protein